MSKYPLYFFLLVISINYIVAQPKLEFEGGNTYDWGKVYPKNNPLKATVKVWNKGNDTLFIKEVKASCGCTTAPIDKNVIPPSEFATLDISLTILGYTGPVNKDIRIYANIPNGVDYYFIKTEVVRILTTLNDGFNNYGEILLGNEYKQETRIKNSSDKDIKIQRIENLPDYCKLNIKPGDIFPANGELNVVATIKPDKIGFFQFSFNIITDISDKQDLYITGWGEVKDNK